MIAVEYHNTELDYCHNCKGVWFDSGELELLLRSQDLEEPRAFFDGIVSSQEGASSEKKRKCPICGRKMRKTAIGGQPKILIDVCPNKHGLWFDWGEVAQLIQRLASEHPPKHHPREHVIGFLKEIFEASSQ